jgi:uncharacterized protein DUF2281
MLKGIQGTAGGHAMQDQTKTTEELFKQLAPEGQEEVRNLIEFLIAKQKTRPHRQPQFDWAGALSDMRDQYSSVDLQHQLLNWRSEPE